MMVFLYKYICSISGASTSSHLSCSLEILLFYVCLSENSILLSKIILVLAIWLSRKDGDMKEREEKPLFSAHLSFLQAIKIKSKGMRMVKYHVWPNDKKYHPWSWY